MHLIECEEYLDSNTGGRSFEAEYEVGCRLRVYGELRLGCFVIQPWELLPLSPPDVSRSIRLLTRTPESFVMGEPQVPLPRNEQYYIPGGMAEEIIVFLTLLTRAHFTILRSLRQRDLFLMQRMSSETDVARTGADGQTLSLGELEPQFRLLAGLRALEQYCGLRRVEPFMMAARHYHLAIGVHNRDETIAYISLVTALEALLHDTDPGVNSVQDWNPELATIIRSNTPGEAEAMRIGDAILKREQFIGRRFKRFVSRHITEAYWADPTRPKQEFMRFKNLEQLEEYVGRIYQARSKALHEGQPFQPTSVLGMNHETPPGSGMTIGSRQWSPSEMLPSFLAFERLVHHVLLEYLRREGAAGFAAELQEKERG